ncbi:axin isoform X1 [Aricia agestis]|uniref:axin isoform X1 n=1 Tax=Aricia agestis TaxID=91739 RepID=UPI001C204AAD|nr:axin isoform X1 [Aricia agestis]XP_041978417.1 axin isoform X1 [Aricia agestis]XP_041978418.1 axin isoform X1 [Aricia agestis]XP_041978419.1 axin isoform X1 [Aricia agestis]XP_041978420.1 axin isoform X1 [Aricia agestis]
MSHTPIGGHPQGWEHKLADRSSLPPASGEEKGKSQTRHVFTHPNIAKVGGVWRSQTEGSSGSSERSPSPPYLRWARTLHHLLEDAEGVRLFRKFVGGAGGLHVDRLNFYFAVHGLRQETEPAKIRQVVSAIYKFLRKSQLAMPEELKQYVKQSLKDGTNIEKTIFDNMEQEVTRAITESTYQAFLRSEAYVSYVSAATQPLSSPDRSPPHSYNKESSVGSGLATLHEGQELAAGAGSVGGAGGPPPRLTHDALMATQSRRLHDVAPRKRSVYSAHVTYAGYTPASRQDSERASLSSGRADSDAVSLSGSSLDGMSMRGGRECRESRHRPRLYGLDRHAVINKEQDSAMVIPRTQRVQSEQLRVLPPAEFAPLLIEKLERVRRDRENKERLERRLAEGDGEDAATQALPPQLVAAAIREKLQIDDDNDQDILDQHVSRVWSERTPGASPPGGRRRRRRAPSALSADSGHYDAPEHPHHPHSLSRRSFSKKTVTELTDSGVSVVSEGTAGAGPRIMLWIAEGSERLAERRARDCSRASSAERERRDRQRARGGGGGSKSSSTSGGAAAPEHTVVVAHFLDESVPYRFKVPAAPLTLRTLKEYLPRKGNYRYFFKTECADLDNTVIQEEVSCDSDTLPMFDGKVMARVKSID